MSLHTNTVGEQKSTLSLNVSLSHSDDKHAATMPQYRYYCTNLSRRGVTFEYVAENDFKGRLVLTRGTKEVACCCPCSGRSLNEICLMRRAGAVAASTDRRKLAFRTTFVVSPPKATPKEICTRCSNSKVILILIRSL